MKTFIFFFCVLGFAFSPNVGTSQTVVIDKDQRMDVDDVFNLIQKQTDFKFVYRSNLFENMPRVSLKKGTISLDELLTKSLSPNFAHEYSRDKVILIKTIRKRPTRFLEKQQETFIIEGQVKDVDGLPIAGASVVMSKSSSRSADTFVKGTETDFDGFFKIEATQGLYLSVFYIGFLDYSEQITVQKKFYNILLKNNINELEEVVLTGYTKTLVKESTVAASKITKKDIVRQKAINLSDKLEGLSPGLNIASVTENGGQRGLELILRGTSTFNQNFNFIDENGTLAQNSANRQPLIVLDGFPYEGPLNDIDPQIIESIDVLKDAAATALWGIRASNGVLVITTKRGRKETKTSITVTSNLTIGTRQDLSQLGLASGADHINIYNQLRSLAEEGGTNAEIIFSEVELPGESRYLVIDDYDQIWADFENPVNPISAAERDRRLQILGQNDAVKDFEKYLLIPGFIQENSLSVQGGGENISIAFTGTHVAEDRPDLGDTFRRLSLSLTTDIKINDKLSTNVDIGVTSSTTRDNGIGAAALTTTIRPYESLVDANGNPRAIRNVYSEFQQEFLDLGFDDPSFNPIADQRLRDNENKRFNLRMALGLNYKLTKNLVADVKFQQNRISSNIRNNLPRELFSIREQNNGAISETKTEDRNFVIRSIPFGGVLQREISGLTNDILRSTLNYNLNFKGGHKLAALTGIEFTSNTTELARRTLYGYDDVTGISRDDFDPRQTSISNGLNPLDIPSFLFGINTVTDDSDVQPEIVNRTVSTFGNLAYTYNDRYNINFSGKIDQATSFGINKRLSKQLLWASSFSWNVDEESFFKVPWVDALKVRASYGVNGNLRRGLTTQPVIFEGVDELITGQTFSSVTDAGNPNLTFEDTATINLGLDFGLFNNRIQATLDVYDRQSRNLLIPDLINPTFGQTATITRNAGAISNRGVEINLNFDILRNSNFTWNGNFNMSYNKNEVRAANINTDTSDAGFFAGLANNGLTEIIGADISSQYRYQWAGLDNTGNPQIFDQNGDIIGVGDALPTVDALEITKPFTAPGFGGLRNTFAYKNVSLSFLASFKFGHVFQEALRPKYPDGVGAFISEDIVNAWQRPGDELFTDIPAIITDQEMASANRDELFTLSDYLLQDASFIRLRDVTLAYRMDSEVLSKIGLNQLNFSFQARNLGLIWRANTLDLDPESIPFSTFEISSVGGFASAFRPGIIPPVTFVFGITANF